jgi:hypothetical protein
VHVGAARCWQALLCCLGGFAVSQHCDMIWSYTARHD